MQLLRVCAAALVAAAAVSCRGDPPRACGDAATVSLTPSALNLAPGEQAGVRAQVGWSRSCMGQVLAAQALPTGPRATEAAGADSSAHPRAVSWRALSPYVATVQALTDSTAQVVAVGPGDTWVLATAVGDTTAVAGLLVTVTGN